MNKALLEERILAHAKLIAAGKGRATNITMHSCTQKDLGFDIYDLSKMIMYAFPSDPVVPDTSVLTLLKRRKNLQLKELCNILYKNLVPLEKYLHQEQPCQVSYLTRHAAAYFNPKASM